VGGYVGHVVEQGVNKAAGGSEKFVAEEVGGTFGGGEAAAVGENWADLAQRIN
jgi:hypothetical protein